MAPSHVFIGQTAAIPRDVIPRDVIPRDVFIGQLRVSTTPE